MEKTLPRLISHFCMGAKMGIFSLLFPSREVRETRIALDYLAKSPLAKMPAFEMVVARARRYANNQQVAIQQLRVVENQSALEIALGLLITICGTELASGNFHTYRGRLSMVGNDKRALFHAIQNMMLERGFMTEGDAQAVRAQLADDIREAG